MDLEPLLRLRERDEGLRRAELAEATRAVADALARLSAEEERLADHRAKRRKPAPAATVGDLLASSRFAARVAEEERAIIDAIHAADRAVAEARRAEDTAKDALARAVGEREAVAKTIAARDAEERKSRERKAERG